MRLPEPRTGGMPVEQTIAARRSIRSYTEEPLSTEELAQLLWAAQGKTGDGRLRAAPSAGATYPLVTYVVVANVTGLEKGLYQYETDSHSLVLRKPGDLTAELSELALQQGFLRKAAAIIVLAAVYERTTSVYGDRGTMYVHLDAGHAAENALLQATSLGLGAVPVGAFRTRSVGTTLGCPSDEAVLYMIPVGRPR